MTDCPSLLFASLRAAVFASLRAGCCAGLMTGSFTPASLFAASPAPVSFQRDILPLLSDHCFQCHGPDDATREAGLRLDTREGASEALAGGLDSSELLLRVASSDPAEIMPPPEAQRPLDALEIDLIRRWIAEGATWEDHWAFVPPKRPAIPSGAQSEDVRNPVDAFLLTRLQSEGLEYSPEARQETLIRRASLDLRGLPPDPAEVAAFLEDTSPDSWERLVDRFLASPRYGERMAWDWLDAARYADSNGYQGDSERTMWPWRDWVVRAFNSNLPFDEFTTQQLAGDLLPDASFDTRLATAFNRNHMINGEGGRIPEENRAEYVMDMSETVGTVWLGLTLNCCRCHNHKYDPLAQEDYYRLFAFFNQTPVDGGGGNPQTPPVIDAPDAAHLAWLTKAERKTGAAAAIAATAESQLQAQPSLPPELDAHLAVPPAERDVEALEALANHFANTDRAYASALQSLIQSRRSLESARNAVPRVMVMADRSEPRPTYVLSKGLYDQPRQRVEPGIPASIAGGYRDPAVNRLDLARWMTSPDNPLTARVAVNRLWRQVFGAGLVRTPEDFGRQGERPTHPELLDWLACEFVESGWDVKHMLRLFLHSAAYRQSSRISQAAASRDPENRLLFHAPRYRLPFWMLRDQALAASGLLAAPQGGPPVRTYQPPGIWEEATFGGKTYARDSGEALYRRSLYVFWRRIVGPPMFFDNASRQVCTVRTMRTNTPLHALATLNDEAWIEAARALATLALRSSTDPSEQLHQAHFSILARPPDPAARDILLTAAERYQLHFAQQPQEAQRLLSVGDSSVPAGLDPIELAAWTLVCSTLFNLDEALNRE